MVSFSLDGRDEWCLAQHRADAKAWRAWGHVASSVILCVALLVVTWLTIEWMQPANSRAAALIGVQWVLMTVAFEFLAGHYVFGSAWATLLADYNLFAGRVWIFVLVTTAFAPLLMARARDAFTPPR